MTNETPNGPEVQSQVATDQPGGNPSILDDPSGVRVGFPSGAVERLKAGQRELREEGATFAVRGDDLDEVLAWVDRFAGRMIAGATEVLGDALDPVSIGVTSELRFDGDDPILDRLDLVRVNGRAFVPETPAIAEDPTDVEIGRALLDLARSNPHAAAVLNLVRREIEDPGADERAVSRAVADAIRDGTLRGGSEK